LQIDDFRLKIENILELMNVRICESESVNSPILKFVNP